MVRQNKKSVRYGKKSPALSNHMNDHDATENGLLPRTDLELVREARHGDMDAFHGLVDRYASYLYGLAVSLIGNAADAEDAVQETLTGAFRGLRSFRQDASVKTWLTRILVRQAAAHHRRRGFRIVARPIDGAADPAGLAETAGADAQMDVREAIDALPPDYREVIVLREMQGMSYEQIAQALAIPRGTVESRLFRARGQLQELLKAYLA
ncbi:MAG TPA: RNA polymerase subunit sigma-24 [Phycisphaerales bacterium]|nr:RNA polymerase subunit sigma-24 [Phycisphaerales bacterium]